MQVLTYLGMRKMSDEYKLRVLLARSHNHHEFNIVYTGMYIDDGELQCPWCGCDFIRDTPGALQRKIHDFNIKKLKEQDDESRTGSD